jgi:hypothetical protein
VLGALRVQQPDLDPSRADRVESGQRAQLCFRGVWLCAVRDFLAEEPVSRVERHGEAGEQGVADSGGGAACGVSGGHQGAVLCARESGGGEA